MEVLDPSVVGWTDSGGLFGAPLEPVAGRERVATLFLRFIHVRRDALSAAGERRARRVRHERWPADLRDRLR